MRNYRSIVPSCLLAFCTSSSFCQLQSVNQRLTARRPQPNPLFAAMRGRDPWNRIGLPGAMRNMWARRADRLRYAPNQYNVKFKPGTEEKAVKQLYKLSGVRVLSEIPQL